MLVPWVGYPIPGLRVDHVADWIPGDGKTDETGTHTAKFLDHASLKFCGYPIPKSNAQASIKFMGPGSLVYFIFDVPELGRIVLLQSHLSVEPLAQKADFVWFAEKGMNKTLVSYVVGNWYAQWMQDIMVWQNKGYVPRPLLVKGDGPVMKLRRWYSQFYSESSRAVGDAAFALTKARRMNGQAVHGS